MAPQDNVTPNPDALAQAARAATKGKGLPPVHLWNPPFCGDLDMRIARDGTWFYQGTPIGRPALVRLFSTILKLEAGKYFLVTPVEKVGITVDDAPFVAVDVEITDAAAGSGMGAKTSSEQDQRLTFETNVGDKVTAGPDTPLRIERDATTGEPAPYVMVRAGLEALIDRKTFYRLVEIGTHAPHAGQQWFGLWSGGQFFPIIPSAELP